jgi:hypothetical protein
MQIRYLNVFLLIFSLFFTPSMKAAGVYPELTPEQMAAYNQQITIEVQKAEELALQAATQMANPAKQSPAEAAVLTVRIQMAAVKGTLAGNFLNTPSLQSPVVRDAFLRLMQQEVITEADLANFSVIVESERPKTAPGF